MGSGDSYSRENGAGVFKGPKAQTVKCPIRWELQKVEPTSLVNAHPALGLHPPTRAHHLPVLFMDLDEPPTSCGCRDPSPRGFSSSSISGHREPPRAGWAPSWCTRAGPFPVLCTPSREGCAQSPSYPLHWALVTHTLTARS